MYSSKHEPMDNSHSAPAAGERLLSGNNCHRGSKEGNAENVLLEDHRDDVVVVQQRRAPHPGQRAGRRGRAGAAGVRLFEVRFRRCEGTKVRRGKGIEGAKVVDPGGVADPDTW